MLKRLALLTAAALVLTACGQPNKAAGYQDSGTPAPVIATTTPPPSDPVVTEAAVDPTLAVTPTAKVVSKPKAKPKPKSKPKPRPKATTAKPRSVYYANCAAVRAAGAAPIHSGDPGYSRKLDRDGDGVACES